MNRKLTDREQIQVIKFAYLQSINESLERLGVNTLRMTGYENDADRVHFTNAGKRCVLYGVKWASLDDLNDGIINLMLLAKNPDLDVWDVRLNLKTFRLKTLERIAYEVYDWCKGEDWEDWEDYRKELIANWLDSYN
jgi:hypothetical protein